jgi:antitoxin PrlF
VRERLGVEAGDKIEFVETEPGVFKLIAATRDVRELKGPIPKPAKPVTAAQMSRVIARMGARLIGLDTHLVVRYLVRY